MVPERSGAFIMKGDSAVAIALKQQLAELATPEIIHQLVTAKIRDVTIEHQLTSLRKNLLFITCQADHEHAYQKHEMDLLCALAIQCLYTEYVFFISPEEETLLTTHVVKWLENDFYESQVLLTLYCCYYPLKDQQSTPFIEISLQQAMGLFRELLRVQVIEPEHEKTALTSIPSLLNHQPSSVSTIVQQHYEENPYPRWFYFPENTQNDHASEVLLNAAIREAQTRLKRDKIKILIAGCGTGMSIVGNAEYYPRSSITAIDLSLSSLAYAKRKLDEFGLENIHLLQADILNLPHDWRDYDHIESVGVLSHLESPEQGVEKLSRCLKTNGTMRLSFYSKAGRWFIRELRHVIENENYQPMLDSIRSFRQWIIRHPNLRACQRVIKMQDFFSVSEFRDLMFHVNEVDIDLSDMVRMIEQLGLMVLGMELDQDTVGIEPTPDIHQLLQQEHLHPEKMPPQYVIWLKKLR